MPLSSASSLLAPLSSSSSFWRRTLGQCLVCSHNERIGVKISSRLCMCRAFPPGPHSKKFPLQQRSKVFPIDDYRASMVSSSVTQPEGVSVHSVDHSAALLPCAWNMACQGIVMAALKPNAGIYKQIPLFEKTFALDAFLAVFHLKSQPAKIFQQTVLPLGSLPSAL